MIQWDSSGTKGAQDRYEVIIYPNDTGVQRLWAFSIWTRKTMVDKADGLPTKQAAQALAQQLVDRLFRDVKKLEEKLYASQWEEDEDYEEDDE